MKAPARMARRASWADTAAVGLIAFGLLLALLLWLDNVHLDTTNGLWKSVVVERWKTDFDTAQLDPSNYLYFPLVAALCRGLDALGIDAGRTWHQLALINTGFAAAGVAIVYWMVRRLTGRRDVAAIAALFHLGCAFFLALAVSNEDIMPSYTFVLAAMAMATVWFAAPTAWQVGAVAAAFALGWLMEWRLMFPTLPPLLLALALSQGSLARRAGRMLLFLAVMLGVALLVVNRWEGHLGAVGLPGVLWTGKGVATGWGGFSLDKLRLVVVGMGEYWLGGQNLPSAHLFSADGAQWGVSFAVQMVLLAIAAAFLWRHRRDPALRNVAVVCLGTLAAGELMNAYSQPTDPQMQLNVMFWLTPIAALVLARLASSITLGRAVIVVAAVLAVVPLAYNVRAFSVLRGRDGRMEAALKALDGLSDPARTVYVYAGWESLVTWQFVTWSHSWEGVCGLGSAPEAEPKFKWISLFSPIVHHPSWTTGQYLDDLKRELDCAFDKGYRVIAGPVWARSARQLADWMTTLNAHDHGAPLHALLQTYRAVPIGGPTVDGPEGYWEVTRR